MKWFILIVQGLFAAWLVSGIAGASDAGNDCAGLYAQACRDGAAIGTGIGIFAIVAFWAFVDVILGLIWLITRKRGPQSVEATVTPARPDAEQWTNPKKKWAKA